MKKMLKVNMLRLLLGMSTLVFLGISGSFTAYADDTPAAPQQHKRVVKGRVTDKKTGEPIVGATVWFKESTSGTATDAAGNYSLNRPQGNAILSVSFIGYKSQEVVLGKEDVINFQLEETSEMIEEAVVVGYGSQRKESVIGAITTVGVAELKQPTGQISNSLAGRLAGVVAVQRSGEFGRPEGEPERHMGRDQPRGQHRSGDRDAGGVLEACSPVPPVPNSVADRAGPSDRQRRAPVRKTRTSAKEM